MDKRLASASRRKNLLSDALQAAADVQNLLAPWSPVMDEAIAQWRRSKFDPKLPMAQRGTADGEFEKSLAWFRALQSSQVLASPSATCCSARPRRTPIAAKISRIPLQQALNEFERLSDDFDPKLRSLMGEALAMLRPFAVGTIAFRLCVGAKLPCSPRATQLLAKTPTFETV